MSSRPHISAVFGAACVALLIAGCSSSGTVGGDASSNSAVGGLTGGNSAGSDGSDAGCTEAMQAIQNAEKAQSSTDLQAVLKVANTSISQLRDAAQTTQKPGGKDAMNKVADDIQTVVSQAESGQQPSPRQALADAQVVAGICGS
ncbi:hypothetical protein ABH935_008710 [Catenulispora sp. GAS73]|uniref:hypothetical protein n=1 Tax=Catenulispora sp. GAS73 TaxID=3156269 RepID=UPI0035123ABE